MDRFSNPKHPWWYQLELRLEMPLPVIATGGVVHCARLPSHRETEIPGADCGGGLSMYDSPADLGCGSPQSSCQRQRSLPTEPSRTHGHACTFQLSATSPSLSCKD